MIKREEILEQIKIVRKSINCSESATILKFDANKLLDLVYKLNKLQANLYSRMICDLEHTIGKELEWAISLERDINKTNTSKKNFAEYSYALERTIGLINVDLTAI